MATTRHPLQPNTNDMMKTLSKIKNHGKNGSVLPFSFLGNLRSSQENQLQQKQPPCPVNLPDLSKLNLGRLKGFGSAAAAHRPVLAEANKEITHVVLSNHTTSKHTIDLLSCLKSSSRQNIKEILLHKLESTSPPKPAFKTFSSISESSPKSSPITSNTPRRNASTGDLISPPKEVPMDIDVEIEEDLEEEELFSPTAEPSGFGKVFACRWNSTKAIDLTDQPENIMAFLSKRYELFDPTVPTAFEIVQMEEERRLKKDWKKEVERAKALQQQEQQQQTLQGPQPIDSYPFTRAGSHRFQFSGN